MTNMYFQVASFFYMLMIIILFFSKKRINNSETRIFSVLSIVNIVGIVLDIAIVFLSYVSPGILPLYILNKFYLLYIVYWASLFCLYIGIISFKSEKNYKTLKNILIYLNVICTIIILFVPIYLFNENNVMYTYGPSVTVTYSVVTLVVLMMLTIVLKNIKNIISKKYSPVIILLILCFVGLLVRKINPALLLTTSIITFINVLMYHTIENPDVKLITEVNEARERAERANNAKTDFLSSMSHEIRTPLNAIVGFSSCIESSKDLEEAKENARDIVSASNTLLEIVSGILDISKIESGKLEITNSNYNPHEKFMELATLMKNKIVEKGIDFQVNIAEDLPNNLYGDHVNLKKIVTNLLSNAYKYTDKGFIKYDVSCVNKGDVCRLIISVEDSGRGIKKENVSKLFTKFQRLEEDRNTTIDGTGLGLAITKNLVELMGGQIILHTVYGEGSKFTVVINQKIDLSNNQVQFVSYDMYDNKKHFSLADKKILVVDDNNLNLKVSAKILERYHADVVLLDSGFKCIESIQNGDYYDLILMDDMMPKLSGIETLQKLKTIKGFNIPTVALTANAIEGMREKYIQAGFDDYLAKPINKDELKKVLRGILYSSKVEKKVSFGDLPSDIYEIGNNNKVDIAQPINPPKIDEEILEIEELDEVDESLEDDWVSYLVKNKVDVSHGLELLGDMEMYNDTMKNFMNEIDDKFLQIKGYKESGDMKNYSILVHSLKSDSKYLGFMDLADISYQHELKSKENDFIFVKDHFDLLEQELKRIINVSNEYLKHI